MSHALDLTTVRAQFPALAVADDGRPRLYLDNPAGTQTPRVVIDRISAYLSRTNANRGASFSTSIQSDAIIEAAREAMAAFIGASSAAEIVFGPNMTSLTFLMARTLAPRLRPGDEILLTRMDHDGNVTPWKIMAERRGATVKWLDFDPETTRFDLADLDHLIGPRTRIAAVNYASNVTGTINDVAAIAARVQAVGGLTFVDAVQFAPHSDVDVAALGCDVLVCSAYKFYGPHAGVLWGRRELLESLWPDKLMAPGDAVPSRYEIGCQNHEGIAGILGAVEYYADLGAAAPAASLRARIALAKARMRAQEEALARRLIDGVTSIRGARVHGLTGRNEMAERVSTVSLTLPGRSPEALAKALAERNIFVWSGYMYALELVRRLGLEAAGGVLRIGPVHYNTLAEIDQAVAAVEEAAAAPV
jgi:cysteine desulfurase family protein (TIGR01976 family)